MNFRLDKNTALYGILFGTLMLMTGFGLSWPFQFDRDSYLEVIYPLITNGWKISLLMLSLFVCSFLLWKKGRAILAEYVGAFAVMLLLYPTISMIAGIPNGIGVTAIFLVVGSMMVIASSSAYMSVSILRSMPFRI